MAIDLKHYGISGTTERHDRRLHRPFPQRQVHRYGRQLQGHRVVDHRGLQERQPSHDRVHLGYRQGSGRQGAVQQEAVRG